MLFITDDTEINLNQGLSALYFYAPWLLFHKKVYALIQEVEKEFAKVKFYGIDISQFEKCINRFKVKSLPTIQIYDKGSQLRQIVGINSIITTLNERVGDIYEVYGDYNKEQNR